MQNLSDGLGRIGVAPAVTLLDREDRPTKFREMNFRGITRDDPPSLKELHRPRFSDETNGNNVCFVGWELVSIRDEVRDVSVGKVLGIIVKALFTLLDQFADTEEERLELIEQVQKWRILARNTPEPVALFDHIFQLFNERFELINLGCQIDLLPSAPESANYKAALPQFLLLQMSLFATTNGRPPGLSKEFVENPGGSIHQAGSDIERRLQDFQRPKA
jgi:hypothetical protein